MKRQKGRAVPPPAPESRANHDYPPGWRRTDWVVPFIGGGACIHHGHETDPNDHSLCGPSIFCCRRAAARYMVLFPEGEEARADWELTEAAHLLSWVAKGVNVFYFVFCDPDRPEGLLAIGLAAETLPDILRRRVPLDTHAAAAERLL
ncbi:hypothetical protein K2Z83_24535 [Oscillochloris sp. ZM17-4]|uniref:hypothetical protein n=1 Tax=Oscillochloris sp. ZM17-4 TaxID=2866714 RepID=UPI001C732C57|nr:hypothetical protein [Oscillochloris sp. ZM17-4]MBX0330830.1 hypothetical protein [Oscillochloris sp. ZM17-4]